MKSKRIFAVALPVKTMTNISADVRKLKTEPFFSTYIPLIFKSTRFIYVYRSISCTYFQVLWKGLQQMRSPHESCKKQGDLLSEKECRVFPIRKYWSLHTRMHFIKKVNLTFRSTRSLHHLSRPAVFKSRFAVVCLTALYASVIFFVTCLSLSMNRWHESVSVARIRGVLLLVTVSQVSMPALAQV